MGLPQCKYVKIVIDIYIFIVAKKEIQGVNQNCKVEIMTTSEVIDYLKEIPNKDILCLGARQGQMSRVLNELEDTYPQKFNKNTVYASISDSDSNLTPDKNSAIFTTYDSSKGLERKVCIVFNYTEGYWLNRLGKAMVNSNILRNIFCVAASRGKDRIIFVKSDRGDTFVSTESLKGTHSLNTNFKGFNPSNMFNFKYKESIEACFNLLSIERVQREDTHEIVIDTTDGLIDISQCIGLYLSTYFKGYNAKDTLKFLEEVSDKPIYIDLTKDYSTDYLILALAAYETSQDRYRTQVRLPFITKEQREELYSRLSEEFNTDETIEVTMQIPFRKGYELMDYEEDKENELRIIGRADVVKNNKVYELKFVNELQHEHYLQCAVYMIGLSLEEGILWNVRKNEMYRIRIKNRYEFLNKVISTITKGYIKEYIPSKFTYNR